MLFISDLLISKQYLIITIQLKHYLRISNIFAVESNLGI